MKIRNQRTRRLVVVRCVVFWAVVDIFCISFRLFVNLLPEKNLSGSFFMLTGEYGKDITDERCRGNLAQTKKRKKVLDREYTLRYKNEESD